MGSDVQSGILMDQSHLFWPFFKTPCSLITVKCICFFRAVQSKDQGDPQPVEFMIMLHLDTPEHSLVLVSKLVLNIQQDWMHHAKNLQETDSLMSSLLDT